MATAFWKMKSLAVAGAALVVATLGPEQASASPLASVAGIRANVSQELTEQVQYRPRRSAPVRPVKRNRAGRDAALAAAIGIGVLGIAAAAAASQPRRGVYYSEPTYPVDSWGRPVYGGHVYARPTHQYYYQQPGYFYEQPRMSNWQREQLRAQERARRDAERRAVREQRAREAWVFQQQQQQYRVRRGYESDPRFGGQPRYLPQRVRPYDDFATSGNRN